MGKSRHVVIHDVTLSSANVTDVNLVLKERAHKIKMKYSMNQYSNSRAYFRQLPNDAASNSNCTSTQSLLSENHFVLLFFFLLFLLLFLPFLLFLVGPFRLLYLSVIVTRIRQVVCNVHMKQRINTNIHITYNI